MLPIKVQALVLQLFMDFFHKFQGTRTRESSDTARFHVLEASLPMRTPSVSVWIVYIYLIKRKEKKRQAMAT